jgi:two-component system OmpR family response regulator
MHIQRPVQITGEEIQGSGSPRAIEPERMPSRVLVVAPDADVRQVLEVLITREGCEVQTASDNATALALAQQWQPDLILLDLGEAGHTPAAFIAAYQQTPDPMAPVIVVSRQELSPDRVVELGGAGWLPNPFALGALLALLAEFAPCSVA